MRKALKDYARKILTDNGCDEFTYGTTEGTQILQDLKEGYPDGMDYPYVDVANAIIAISKRKPLESSTWHVHWDTDSCCDGFPVNSLAQGKNEAYELLIGWMVDQQATWGSDIPTGEEADMWNYMIYNSDAGVTKYNPWTDEYEEYWYPSDKQKAKIGWKIINTYTVKPEFLGKWGPDTTTETIFSAPQVKQFAKEQGCTVSSLLKQLNPYDF